MSSAVICQHWIYLPGKKVTGLIIVSLQYMWMLYPTSWPAVPREWTIVKVTHWPDMDWLPGNLRSLVLNHNNVAAMME